MAHLIRQVKAEAENVTMKIDIDGKNVELDTKFEGVTNWQKFEDLMQMLDYQAQLADCLQTIVNELNQAETVNLIVGEEK